MATSSEMDSDAQLIDRVTAGDGPAFALLVGRHQRPVYAYLARRAGPSAADDLLADVWLAAFGSRGSFDARQTSARPWLFGIARNVLRSHWARHRGVSPVIDEADDPWPRIDDRLAAAATAGKVRAAVEALPAPQREILLLVAWEDLAPTEIAQMLGIPAGTVRSHLSRARRALREHATVLAIARSSPDDKET